MIENNSQKSPNPVDSYMLLKQQRVYKQQQLSLKKSSRNHAIFQGLLAVGCVALGRYSLDKSNPLAFLLCLACARGAVEEHSKALSQYFNTHRNLSKLRHI